jgi:hypothetical protein
MLVRFQHAEKPSQTQALAGITICESRLRVLVKTIRCARVRESDCCDAVTGLFGAGLNHARSRNVAFATQHDSMDQPWCGNAATVSNETTVGSLGSQDQSKNAKTAEAAESRREERALHVGVRRARATAYRRRCSCPEASDHVAPTLSSLRSLRFAFEL